MNQTEIPEGWEEKSLSDMTDIVKGITYKSSDYCEIGQGAIFINLKCISKSGGFNKEGVKFYKGIIKNKQILQHKDIIIAAADLTREGDIIGYPLFVPKFGSNQIVTMSMDVAKLQPKNEMIDKLFLFYRLCMPDAHEHMRANSGGSTVLHLSLKKVGELKLKIPKSLAEQQKIVYAFLTIDNTIDKTKDLIEKYKKIKQGLMEDLFTKGIDEDGKPHKENIEKELSIIPKNWKIEVLGKKAKINMGQSPESSECNEDGNGYAFLQGNADFGVKYPKPMLYCTFPKKIAKSGEILISVRAPVGDLNIADIDYCIGRGLASIKPYDNMERDYLYYALFLFRTQLYRVMQGTTFEAVNRNDLFMMQIRVPNKEEQKRIADRLKAIDKKIDSEQSYLDKLLKIKTGIMQDLLTGKKRVAT